MSESVRTPPFAAFEWLLSGRYLRARRKEGFISVIAGFSFLGIMLGVATLIIVMAVMNGFRKELLGKILGKAPLAVGMVLECVNAHYAKGVNGYEEEVKAFGRAFESEDFKEGTTAFVEKRPAVFTGK